MGDGGEDKRDLGQVNAVATALLLLPTLGMGD